MQFNQALKYNIGLKSINVVILFFINLVFVRIAGADISGDFFYLITLLSFITLLVSCSLESGITFYASKDKGPAHFAPFIIVTSMLQIILSFSIVFFAVQNPTSLSWIYLLIFIISHILIANFTALYVSRKWFIPVNVIVLIVNLTTLLFLWFLLKRDNPVGEAEKIYIISFAAQAIALILFFLIKSGNLQWKLPAVTTIKKILNYSFLALAGNVSFFLVTRLDYVFVKEFSSSEALGNYIQVSKIGQMFILIPAMAASVIFPFAANSNENILARVQWLCRLMTVAITAGSIFIFLGGKWIFPWVFGKDFTLMYPAMLFYLPGIFSLCITSLLASFISGKGFIAINVMASCIALVIVIIGDIIFIPKYGINAAAAVSSLAYMACMIFLLRHCIKKYHGKLSDFLSISFTGLKNF